MKDIETARWQLEQALSDIEIFEKSPDLELSTNALLLALHRARIADKILSEIIDERISCQGGT